jgi:cytochrome c oxidase cbb3-type subunit 3
MAHERDVDQLSGTATTGHEWDGIRELNPPLPRWWLWIFYLTIVWSIGYWIVYPSWPLMSSYTVGLFNWHSREAIIVDMEELKAQRGPMVQRLAQASLQDVVADENLSQFARAWGGRLEDIALTIRDGVRTAQSKERQGSMPAFGRDGILKRPDIEAVTDYVRSLAGLGFDPTANLDHGKKVYGETCVACHGADGRGNREIGAPNLTDAIWLYGSDRTSMIEGLWNGRGGMMPAWAGRLDESTIKALTIYVHTLGGGVR